MIGIINYGFANISSVKNAVYELGYDCRVLALSDNPLIEDFTHIILPGVGNFGLVSECLRNSNFVDFINCWVKENNPILGICLGMQLLYEGSEESPGSSGLGLLPGMVKRFSAFGNYRVPHVGWNEIQITKKDEIISGIKNNCDMYFVHSYYCPLGEFTLTKSNYGVDYSSSVKKNNIFGVQFHPEKSQKNGLQLLDNFLKLA